MQNTDYSIEFCHIYLNETFSAEHKESIEVLKTVIESLGDNSTYSLKVLIDDYNATDEVLDIAGFKQELADAGVSPDYLAYEARLAPYAESLLNYMKEGRIKRNYRRYIEQRGNIPCSFMIAIWYLLRLGALEQIKGELVYEKNGGHTKAFVADSIISILPERFRGVEEKAQAIIESTPFADLAENINRVFYDSLSERVEANVA